MEYYSHTIRITNFSFIDIEKVEDILISGYLYSRRNLQKILHINNITLSEETCLFNGMDYVSLCDLSKKGMDYSAYNMYVNRGLSFLFNKDMEVIIPTVINTRIDSYSFFGDAHMLGLGKERYSDLKDEVQVKDKVSLNYLEGMALSLNQMKKFHNNQYLIEYLKLLKDVLIRYQKNIPIINLDNQKEIMTVQKLNRKK